MTVLASKTFTTLVGDFATAVQGAARTLVDFTIGSILRAVGEAASANALWLQGLAYQVLAATRLATSAAADVDSFIADFGLARLPAVAATGLATFARFTPTLAAVVPVGATVASADGAQQFAVTADSSNPAFSPTAANGAPGYAVAASVASVAVPVRAVNAGRQGNITAGALALIQTGISGIDTVTNVAPFINGIDAEADAAVRARFVLFINSLAKATDGAIGYAIASVQQGMQWQIFENQDPNGVTDYGMVTVFVDDGSGSPAPALVTQCGAAVDAVRAASVRVGVYPASMHPANVTMTIATAAGYYHPDVVAAVVNAIGAYINGLGLGATLSYMRIAQVAFDASPGVTDVVNYTLNNLQADLVPAPGETIKASAILVS